MRAAGARPGLLARPIIILVCGAIKPVAGSSPASGTSGRSHEVKRFEHPQDSVVAYLHNLNTNRAYQRLRDLRRADARTGRALAGRLAGRGLAGLLESRRRAYVKDIQAVIIANDLEQRLPLKLASQ